MGRPRRGHRPTWSRRPSDESTQQCIDEEITRIIRVRYEKVVGFGEVNRATVERIARRLLEVETIGEEEFKALAGGAVAPPN
jgi:cell division protease FtsH